MLVEFGIQSRSFYFQPMNRRICSELKAAEFGLFHQSNMVGLWNVHHSRQVNIYNKYSKCNLMKAWNKQMSKQSNIKNWLFTANKHSQILKQTRSVRGIVWLSSFKMLMHAQTEKVTIVFNIVNSVHVFFVVLSPTAFYISSKCIRSNSGQYVRFSILYFLNQHYHIILVPY